MSEEGEAGVGPGVVGSGLGVGRGVVGGLGVGRGVRDGVGLTVVYNFYQKKKYTKLTEISSYCCSTR